MLCKKIEQMADFSAKISSWADDGAKMLNLYVVGLNRETMSLWNEIHSPFMENAEIFYKNWFIANRWKSHVVCALLDYALSVSGRFLFKEALTIFYDFFAKGPAMADPGISANNFKLTNVLTRLYADKENEIKRDEGLFNKFKELVQYLLSINAINAMELQARLVEDK